ncbi:MAG: transcriptional repressor [Candidatus Staskawiczbacteria bacterium]|nr:transcriptional repressor [Candidatus Staskawiczbacteria bacterium]
MKTSTQEKKERMTAQKSFIFGFLKSVKTHPTAETVYEEVKKKLPTISQGTVYRVLNNFKDKGQILTTRILFAKNAIKFLMCMMNVRIVEF